MPPIPTACQALDQDVQNLVNDAQALRTDALNAVGAAAWQKLSALGLKLLELDRKRAELQKCIDAHTGTFVCGFTAIDAGGGGSGDERRAELWDVSGPQPTVLETVPIQSGSFAFTTTPSAPVAVAISGTDTATSTGPDFRSGALTSVPATPNVEVVLGPIVTLTADDIARWFGAIPPAPAQTIDVSGVGSITVDIQSVAAALVPPASIRLTGVGTVSGSTILTGSGASPLSATLTLGLVPATNPEPLLPAELTLAAPPHVDVSGPFALFGAVLNAALSTFMADFVLNLMRPIVQAEMSKAVARALSLVGLPASVTLSIRKLSITSTSVTFQPVLGAVGNVLSTYQPPAAEVVTP